MGEAIGRRLRPLLDDIASAGSAYLNASAAALRAGAEPPAGDQLQRALERYASEIAAMGREGMTMALAGDAAERFFTIAFALEQMRLHLLDLARLLGEWRLPRT